MKDFYVSIRVDAETLELIDNIYSNYIIGSAYYKTNTNKSFVIVTALNFLSRFDFNDEKTYMEIFGRRIGEKYKKCINLVNKPLRVTFQERVTQ